MEHTTDPTSQASRSPRPQQGGGSLSRAAALLLTALLCATARAAPLLYPSDGHYYEAVRSSGGITWDQANAAAKQRTYNGVQGHLAVIPTPAVNTFLAQHFDATLHRRACSYRVEPARHVWKVGQALSLFFRGLQP